MSPLPPLFILLSTRCPLLRDAADSVIVITSPSFTPYTSRLHHFTFSLRRHFPPANISTPFRHAASICRHVRITAIAERRGCAFASPRAAMIITRAILDVYYTPCRHTLLYYHYLPEDTLRCRYYALICSRSCLILPHAKISYTPLPYNIIYLSFASMLTP